MTAAYLEVSASSRSFQRVLSMNSRYDRDGRGSERRYLKDETRSESRGLSRRDNYDSKGRYHAKETGGQYEPEYGGEYGRKRSKYEGTRRTPGRSNWDDGKWEWEDAPCRESYSSSSKRRRLCPSPMFVGASPDARLVSPLSTPHSTGYAASPRYLISPSPVPIRASGSLVKSSSSGYSRRSHQLTFSNDNSQSFENGEADQTYSDKEQDCEITESMRQEMENNSDRAWYDREEGNAMFDIDSSSFFLGDDASFRKKEVELAKRLLSDMERHVKRIKEIKDMEKVDGLFRFGFVKIYVKNLKKQ